MSEKKLFKDLINTSWDKFIADVNLENIQFWEWKLKNI